MKQSAREFNKLLCDWLVAQGWRQLMSNPCIYIFESDGIFAMIALYVDDILFACDYTAWRVAFTALVRSRFDIKDHGELSDIIGMHITRERAARTISLDQGKYVCELLEKHDMSDYKPFYLPMDSGLLTGVSKLTPVPLTGKELEIYPSLLGSLQYAAVCTRPDISTALNILGSAHANPTEARMKALKKVLRYLNGKSDMSMTFGGVRTTHSNLYALRMQTGATTTRHGGRGQASSLHFVEGPSTTSHASTHASSLSSHSLRAKRNITPLQTPPRRLFAFDR
jgi:hypothetical protein